MSKKILMSLGLTREAFEEPVQGEVEFQSPDAIDSEGENYLANCDQIGKTQATLESLNMILDQAPDDQINETLAKVVSAVIEDINGDYEIKTAPSVATERLESVSARVYLSAAKEDIKGKLAAFKETAGKIIDKIIELIQRFWQWLTLNHERVKASLAKAKEALRDADGQQVLPFQVKYKQLGSGKEVNQKTIVDTGETLSRLCEAGSIFAESAFHKITDTSLITNRSTDALNYQISAVAKVFFSKFHTSNPGEYLFYSNIGGRKFAMALNPDKVGRSDRVFETVLTPVETAAETPEEMTFDKKEIDYVLNAGNAVVDVSDQHFKSFSKIQKDLKRARQSVDKPIDPKVLKEYSRYLMHFISGAFTQALRYGDACAALGMAYAKKANNVVATV